MCSRAPRHPDSPPVSHVCLALRIVRVCVAFQLRVSVAVLLELTELAKPIERPCSFFLSHEGDTMGSAAAAVTQTRRP